MPLLRSSAPKEPVERRDPVVDLFDRSLEKAAREGLSERVEWQDDWVYPQWPVPSLSQQGVVYRVSLLFGGLMACTCDAHTKGGLPWCVHRAAVFLFLRDHPALPFAKAVALTDPRRPLTRRECYLLNELKGTRS